MSVDLDVVERYRIEPPTPRESEWESRIDVADYAIFRTKLELICEEAKAIMVRMGISDAIQAGDCICGIYSIHGDMAVASLGTYLHAATGQIPIKYARKHYADDPSVGLRDGDNFFANEALYGGIHNPDMMNVIPLMVDGELIGWAGAASHEPETGAIVPGGLVPGAKSRYEEGLKVPPLKIGENFRLKTDVMTMVANNVRDERTILNDMRARSAACMKLRQRVLELVAETGTGFFVGMLRKLLTSAAQGARNRIAQLNDGTFRHSVFFDTRGYEEGLGRISIALIKKGDEITIDMTGTSPQTQCYLNTRPHVVRAIMIGDLCQYLFSDLPASSALLDPFTVIVPDGSCFKPSLDAPLTGGARLGSWAAQAIHGCVNKLIFDSPFRDRVALPLGSGRNVAHASRNQFDQTVMGLIPGAMNAQGGGAQPTMDGTDAAGMWFSGMGDSLDIEHEELRTPFLYMYRNIPRDQGGFGKYRGGSGAANCIVVHNAMSPVSMVSVIGTARFPMDPGMFGGYAGGVCPMTEIKGGGWHDMLGRGAAELPTTFHDLIERQAVPGQYNIDANIRKSPYAHGDSLAFIASSAGGYGDVLERAPELVERDLHRGFISSGVAERVYKVAFDGNAVDVDATQAMRDAERADRKRRGHAYDAFITQWRKLRPRPEIIREFGPWDDAQ